MSLAQEMLEYKKGLDGNQQLTRKMVLESYSDIESGKGRDSKDFFNNLEKRYSKA